MYTWFLFSIFYFVALDDGLASSLPLPSSAVYDYYSVRDCSIAGSGVVLGCVWWTWRGIYLTRLRIFKQSNDVYIVSLGFR